MTALLPVRRPKTFLRNAAFSFIGGLLPALALIVTIPLIVHRLGAEAYGALVLITSIVGYFGIIDVNATAGSVKYVSEHQARGETAQANQVVTFGLLLYVVIGLLGALALWFGSATLAQSVFKIPEGWRAEAEVALRISALAFFVGQLQVYLQSIPQAMHRFDVSGQLDAAFGTLVPVVTISVVLAGGGLAAIVAARLGASLLHCCVLVVVLRRLMPEFRLHRPVRDTVHKMTSFSAWAYLQRIATVTHQNADKLLIGAQQSMLALATYVIPYTLVSRLYSLLFRLTQNVFPMASALVASGQVAELKHTYTFAARYTVYLSACLCLVLALFAQDLLYYWLGAGLDSRAPLILVLVAYTLFLESLSNLPSLVNDGLGRPVITGVASLLRVAIGLVAAWWSLTHYGVVALAVSQLLVTAVMSIGFVVLVHRLTMPWALATVVVQAYMPGAALLLTGTVLVAWRLGGAPMMPLTFVAWLCLVVTIMSALGWRFVLSAQHRQRLSGVVLSRFRQA